MKFAFIAQQFKHFHVVWINNYIFLFFLSGRCSRRRICLQVPTILPEPEFDVIRGKSPRHNPLGKKGRCRREVNLATWCKLFSELTGNRFQWTHFSGALIDAGCRRHRKNRNRLPSATKKTVNKSIAAFPIVLLVDHEMTAVDKAKTKKIVCACCQ